MRSVFGIVALLVTLAIVALVVKQQMRATGLVTAPAAASTPGAPAPVPQTPQAQMSSAQQQVMQGIADADRQAQQQRDAAEQAAGK